MVGVRRRPSRPSECHATSLPKQRQRLCIAQIAIPGGSVHSKPTSIDGTNDIAGINTEMNHRRSRRAEQLNVSYVENGLRGGYGALNEKARAVRCPRHSQTGKR